MNNRILIGNLVVFLLLVVIASLISSSQTGDTAFVLFWLMVPLVLLNGIAVLWTLLFGAKVAARTWLLSVLLLLLIGLGVCGYSLQHIHVN